LVPDPSFFELFTTTTLPAVRSLSLSCLYNLADIHHPLLPDFAPDLLQSLDVLTLNLEEDPPLADISKYASASLMLDYALEDDNRPLPSLHAAGSIRVLRLSPTTDQRPTNPRHTVHLLERDLVQARRALDGFLEWLLRLPSPCPLRLLFLSDLLYPAPPEASKSDGLSSVSSSFVRRRE
jgi:hypothetical protein